MVNGTPRPLHPWERPSTHCTVRYRRVDGPFVTKLVLSLASLIPQSPTVHATQSRPLTSHSRTSCRIVSITRILWCGGRPAAGRLQLNCDGTR